MKNNKKLFEDVITTIKEHTGIEWDISEKDVLKDNLGIDSLDLIDIVTDLENKFNVSLPYEINVETVEELVDLIEEKLK
jgi:acyl carrier protein